MTAVNCPTEDHTRDEKVIGLAAKILAKVFASRRLSLTSPKQLHLILPVHSGGATLDECQVFRSGWDRDCGFNVLSKSGSRGARSHQSSGCPDGAHLVVNVSSRISRDEALANVRATEFIMEPDQRLLWTLSYAEI